MNEEKNKTKKWLAIGLITVVCTIRDINCKASLNISLYTKP